MNDKKAHDKKVYTIMSGGLVATLILWGIACNRELDNATPKTGVKNITHATEVYEIEFDGAKYIVVQTYKGVGICPKAGEVVWTKEVKN